ncbi:MAG: ATP-binding protein [Leptolinea sp.]
MQSIPFVGRERELQVLNELWQSKRSEFLILYGRRRVGKTRLLKTWAERSQARVFYWVADPTSSFDQLRSFSQALFNFTSKHLPAAENFDYGSWRQAFQVMADLAEHERIAIFIDEFTYLLEAESGIAGILQNVWDQILNNSNMLMVLSGSHLGMMQRQVLSYQAPLYGRATGKLQLEPLRFGDTSKYFPNFNAEERVALYAMLGGIPAYWERVQQDLNISENIRKLFLSPNTLLQDEPRLLLQDFLKEQRNYVTILKALAAGAATPTEISPKTGMPASQIPQYLENLIETGFIARKTPVTRPENTKLGRHIITDPYLRFYFRFLSHRQSQLAFGVQEQTLDEIKRHLLDFIGTHTWEELCREWLLKASALKELPFEADQVGSAWTRAAQIDVVGINRMEKTLYFGECKWGAHKYGRDIVVDLVEKSIEFIPADGYWKVYYLGFARSGWTDAAHQFVREKKRLQGANWKVEGAKLLSLDQVDQDLKKW